MKLSMKAIGKMVQVSPLAK